MKRILSLVSVLALLFATPVLAQENTISNVAKVNLRNSGEILQGNDVKGYFMLYKADKVGKGSFSYRLIILDQNVNEVGEKKIVASKFLYLIEAAYNEEVLALKFYDSKEKKVILRFLNNQAEELYKKTLSVSKREILVLNAAVVADQPLNKSLIGLPGKGFLHYQSVKNKKMGYSVTFYPNDPDGDDWEYKSAAESPFIEYASFLTSDDDVIVSSLVRKKNQMTRDYVSFLIAHNPKTGDEMFEIKLEDEKWSFQLMNAYLDKLSGNVQFFGYYFEKEDKEFKGKSIGLCQVTVDKSGKVLSKNFVSWTKEVAEFMPVSKRGKLEGIGFLFFHKIIQTDDGKVYAIGEQYQKKVSGVGVASNMLNSRNSNVANFQMVVKDMYVFEFDKDFNLQAVESFEKGKSVILLPRGADYYGPRYLANYIYVVGGFDYKYTQVFRGGKVFTVGYVDYEKLKGEKNRWVYGTISHSDGEYTADQIELETDATRVNVMAAKAGYVLMQEYYKKEKKIELRLEKVNY